MSKKWVYLSNKNEAGEFFALAQTWNKQRPGTNINFWHITAEHEYLFTFRPNSKYNKATMWSENLCRELEADLRSQSPSVEVIRFAVDGAYIFKTEEHQADAIPKPPVPITQEPAQKTPEQLRVEVQRRRRILIEEEMGRRPAPFVLFGRHDNFQKEYAWKLTPDKPKRRGIVPGDRVLVWTRNGFTAVTVTRIEPAEGKKQPKARVKKKIFPGDPKNEA